MESLDQLRKAKLADERRNFERIDVGPRWAGDVNGDSLMAGAGRKATSKIRQ